MFKRLKMRSKLILIFVVTALIPMLVLSYTSYSKANNALTDEVHDKIRVFNELTEESFNTFFEDKMDAGLTLATTARLYNSLSTYIEKGPDSAEWQEAYQLMESFLPDMSNRIGMEAIYITDNKGMIVYASGVMKPNMEGVDISTRAYYTQSIAGTQNISPFTYSKIIEKYFVAVATPIRKGGSGEVIGTANTLLTLDSIEAMLQANIKTVGESADIYLVDGEGLLNSNTMLGDYAEGAAFVETIDTYAAHQIAEAIKSQNYDFYDSSIYIDYLGNEVLGGYTIVSIGDSKLGMVVEIDTKEALAQARSLLTTTLVIVGIALVFSTSLLLIFIESSVRKPIANVVEASARMSDGDLDVKIDIMSQDEIGLMATAFSRMAENINEVMTNINAASDQVAAGSRQVSDTSMALSSGATEQASSIEELTASIQQIAAQTRLNAQNANEANTLALNTRNKADLGNGHMQDMLRSMHDINDSSKNISKIIKVIDEIAFQTNILALNAAVEAARAGEHGKGFAVVAEEVRNLAARSANAAKETTAMIEGSMLKVHDGTRIANATADALGEIVDSIQRVNSIVNGIAQASEEQALSVDQINIGIAQIADVVQTTSATSQETAAASEELSSQAELLKNQVGRFKLKVRSPMVAQANFGAINPDIYRMLEQQVNHQNGIRSDIKQSKDYGKY